MEELNNSTYRLPGERITVVGDEKQTDFYPRVKIKAWDNDANLSIGTTDTNGTHAVEGDVISYATDDRTVRFYPTGPTAPTFDKTKIRYQKLGAIPYYRIGSIYELNNTFPEAAQTINYHWSDQRAMMYYGYYNADSYLDLSKLDIPEMRVAIWGPMNDPMVMDETLKLIDIRYNEQRDDLVKIRTSMQQAVQNILAPYNVQIDNPDTGKLYFHDGVKRVKFYSDGYFGGHFYFYINLGLDYQSAHDYYRDDVTPRTQDAHAYGLRAIVPDLPDSVIDDIIHEYAKLYGLPLQEAPYSANENKLLAELDVIHQDTDWVRYARRSDVYDPTNEPTTDGYEFEIELFEPPASNVVPLTLTSKNLAYYYQPELTAEERLQGHKRAPNVVGSYAAYHVSKSNNEYEAGKAFHIYRPWAQDATGKKVWCELFIDTDENGLPTTNQAQITVPQDFLATATYPVIIDPVFGYAGAGASSVLFDDTIKATLSTVPASPSSSLTLTNMKFYGSALAGVNDAVKYEMAVYKSSDNSLVAQTANYNANGSINAGWNSLSFSGESITANTDYLLAVWGINTGPNAGYTDILVYYDSSGGTSKAKASQTYVADGWPSPTITWDSPDESRRYSIYATYSGPAYTAFYPLFGTTNDPSATSNYIYPNATHVATWNATLTNREIVISDHCSISNLNVAVTTAPGTGNSKTFTLMKNGLTTILSATISGTATTASDSTDQITLAPGDTLTLRVTHGGTPTASGNFYWNMQVNSNTMQISGANSTNTTTTANATRYTNINSGYGLTYATTEGDVQIIAPTAGTIKNLYVKTTVAPGAAASGKYYDFSLSVNAGTPTLTTRINETATSNSNAVDVAISAGDLLSLRVVNSGTAPTATAASWTLSFEPTNASESFFGFGNNNATGTTAATRYEQPYGIGANSYNATENTRYIMIGPYMLKKFYAKIGTDPGGGTKKWTATIRNNAAATSLTVDITDNTTKFNVAADVLPTAFQFQSMDITPANTPSALGGIHTGILISTLPTTQTITGKSRITATTTKTITGKANIASAGTTTTQTITGKSRITATTTKTITGVARITATTTKTITGKSRITAQATQTITGKSRITAKATQTITGVARVTATTTKTITGVGRITATTTKTQTGVARISKVVPQTITGTARITATTTKTQTGKARITATTTQTVTGKARITNSATQTITGKAKITTATNQTITGVARITAQQLQTITGKARITKTATQTITGLGRIALVSSQTQTGKARITVSTTQTQTGVARITATTTRTQTGVAKITNTTTRTITGKAQISGASVQTITGKSRIEITQLRLQTGKAAITNTTTQTITGKAKIGAGILTTAQTITGRAAIASTNAPRLIFTTDGDPLVYVFRSGTKNFYEKI